MFDLSTINRKLLHIEFCVVLTNKAFYSSTTKNKIYVIFSKFKIV